MGNIEYDIGDPGLGGERVKSGIMTQMLLEYAYSIVNLDLRTSLLIQSGIGRARRIINEKYLDSVRMGLDTSVMLVPEAEAIIKQLFFRYIIMDSA